jgi:integrase
MNAHYVFVGGFCHGSVDMAEPLSAHLERYFQLNLKIRSDHSRRIYKLALLNLGEAIGHVPALNDLSDDNVVLMMRRLLDSGLSVATVNERRARIHALWTWLAKRNVVNRWPTTPPLDEPMRIPRAWSRGDLVRLLAMCQAEVGWIGGVRASLWWTSLHLALWDSGERISALIGCRWEFVSDGWLHVPAELRKGKAADAVYKLAPATLAILDEIREPERGLIWPWPKNRTYLWDRYRTMRRRHGLPDDPKSSFHRMRKSVATHFHAAGGNATDALGHSGPEVTRRSYLDPTLINEQKPADILFRIDQPPDPPNAA